MKRKVSIKRRYASSSRKRTSRRIHHRIISHFRGNGGIYAILVLGTAMAGAFALTGGILPQLNPNPPASSQVEIDTTSARQSSESALQLQDIKVKSSPPVTPVECSDQTAVAIVVDVSGSMETVDPGATTSRINRLKDALKNFLTFFKSDSAISFITFSGSGDVVVPIGRLSQNRSTLNAAIDSLTAAGSTNMRNGLAEAAGELEAARSTFTNYNQYTVFMTDGVPESSDCRYRNVTGRYRYYQADERTICTLEGTNTEPTFFTHKWSPIEPANDIKASGARIFSIAMFQPSSDTEETNKNNKAEDLMRAVASDPDSTYYVSNPTTKNLTSTYQEIARKICTSPN